MNFDRKIVDEMIHTIPPIVGGEPFGLLIEDGDPQCPIYFDAIESSILTIDNRAEIKFGMSKMVISAPSLNDIVIKIPFDGMYDFCYEDDLSEESDITFFDGMHQYNFIPFEHARSKQRANYCQVELEKYNTLFKLDLDIFIAETQFYTTLENGLKVYIQEKVYPSEDNLSWMNKRPSLRSKNIAQNWIEKKSIAISQEWIGLCIDVYGEGRTEEFLNYCNYEDPIIISDLHSGNIGFRKDGSPIILDYSGFED